MPRRTIPKIIIKPKNSNSQVKVSTVRQKSQALSYHNPDSKLQNAHGLFFKDSSHLMKEIVFVAYYTFNTPYEAEAVKLKESLKKLDLLYDIVPVPSVGNWQDNTRYKAKFLQQMLLKHKGKNLVYIDVDAIVHSIPIHFKDYTCDIGIRYQDFRWRKNECLSGTIYMSNTAMMRELCKIWEGENIAEGPNAKTFEQWNLGKAIEDMRNKGLIKDGNLPPEYTMIFDSMREMYPTVDPVIEHFQASRKLRNKV